MSGNISRIDYNLTTSFPSIILCGISSDVSKISYINKDNGVTALIMVTLDNLNYQNQLNSMISLPWVDRCYMSQNGDQIFIEDNKNLLYYNYD